MRLAATLGLLAVAALPALAQDASEPTGIPAARAVQQTVEQVRALRAVNRARLTAEQGAQVIAILDTWEQQRNDAEQNAAAKLSATTAALRQAADHLREASELVPAENAYTAALRERDRTLDQARSSARDRLFTYLRANLTQAQAQIVTAAGKEAMLAQGPGNGRGAPGAPRLSPTEMLLGRLERLREAPPQFYQTQRDQLARSLAGVAAPRRAARGGPGGNGQPVRGPARQFGNAPVIDPAAAQRMAEVAAQLDRIRTMTPAVWQSQRERIAAQLGQGQEAARVASASPEQALRTWIETYLLLPSSPAALRERFDSEK